MLSFEMIIAMLLVGCFAGFIAGLFGVGGGMIIVPIVLWTLQLQGLEHYAHAQHIAVGTSFAVMIFTTLSSAIAQNRKKSVDWDVVKRMAPGMVLGVMMGAIIAKYLPNYGLQIFFIIFTIIVAIKTLLDAKPKPSRQLPKWPILTTIGAIFGIASSWVGIGGGSLSVPFLLYCNVPPHRATGTSSGLAWPIAVVGTLGYLFSGWSVENLPSGSFGFVYLPAVAILSLGSIVFAPMGVKVAHKLPPKKLKFSFGLLLLFIAVHIAFKAFG